MSMEPSSVLVRCALVYKTKSLPTYGEHSGERPDAMVLLSRNYSFFLFCASLLIKISLAIDASQLRKSSSYEHDRCDRAAKSQCSRND